MEIVIGVLALQGAFAKHLECLQGLGVTPCEVRYPEELQACDGLIIPGGESTTMLRLLRISKMEEALKEFAAKRPLFGSCAGLILMSREVYGYPMNPLGLLDIAVERNAFGRQIESFSTELDIHFQGRAHHQNQRCQVYFIRAPRIRQVGAEVQVLSSFENEPVLVQQGHHLGASFHIELTQDQSLHQYFVHLVKQAKRAK